MYILFSFIYNFAPKYRSSCTTHVDSPLYVGIVFMNELGSFSFFNLEQYELLNAFHKYLGSDCVCMATANIDQLG